MQPYAGFEPQVGEIRALRTFRVGPGGVLYALFTPVSWRDGTNTACCRRRREVDDEAHDAPDPECSCGIYAYGDEESTGEYAYARHVLAVVSCFGRVIAGSRGVRAEHARVDALWMSPSVPADLAEAVACNYPGTRIYADRLVMLDEHAPTRLDCYDPPTPSAAPRSRQWRWAVGGAVTVGALPARWLDAVPGAGVLLAGVFGLFLACAFVLGRRPGIDVASRRRSLWCVALALWLVSPLIGVIGLVMFRLPLLQIVGVSLGQRLSVLRAAGRFPARIS